MWNEKSSSSPISAIGEATATTSNAMPSEKSAMRQPGTGCPRCASVRARTAYAAAMSTIGASWRGSIVQLVSRDGSSTVRTVRSGRGRGRADLRGCRRLDREGGRGGRAASCRSRVHRSDGIRRVRGAPSAGRRPLPGRLDRLGGDEAHPRARAWRAARVRRRPGGALHQRRQHLRRRPALLPRLRRSESDRARDRRRARRGRCGGLPRGRMRADRRRDGGAARDLPRGRARLRRHVCRDRRARGADRRLADRGRRRGGRSSVGRRARERVHARAQRARGRGLHG